MYELINGPEDPSQLGDRLAKNIFPCSRLWEYTR
jgi:hypothetical protein